MLLYSPGRLWRQRSRGSASDAVQCYLLYDTIIGMISRYYYIAPLSKTNTTWIAHVLPTHWIEASIGNNNYCHTSRNRGAPALYILVLRQVIWCKRFVRYVTFVMLRSAVITTPSGWSFNKENVR